MALGMSVESPSTGASAAEPWRQTPNAELEVPKSSPQAVMKSPCGFECGALIYYAKTGLASLFLRP
jgi:hypothetical protein